MSEANHDLAHEFPEYRSRIQDLKQKDGHFLRLASEYHELCKQLHRIELQLETPADEVAESLKLKRLRLKDELYQMLKS
jgi:uncharacterized protein YdcH (DUF465 family)